MCHSAMIAFHEIGFDDPIGKVAGGNPDLLGSLVARELLDGNRLHGKWAGVGQTLARASNIGDYGTIVIVLCRLAALQVFLRSHESRHPDPVQQLAVPASG